MLTAAPRTLWLEIFRSAPYSTTVPKKPALRGQATVSGRGQRSLGAEAGARPPPACPPTARGEQVTPDALVGEQDMAGTPTAPLLH